MVILTPETADLLGSRKVAGLVGRVHHKIPSPLDSELAIMRANIFTTVMGNLNRSKGTNGTPSEAYTSPVLGQHSIYPGGYQVCGARGVAVLVHVMIVTRVGVNRYHRWHVQRCL